MALRYWFFEVLGSESVKEAKSLQLVCLFVVISICFVQELRSSEMVTPKYFVGETLSISTLCRMYLVLKGFGFL